MKKNKKNILWVDDKIYSAEMRPDRDELEAGGFNIKPIDSADMFIEFINSEKDIDNYVCVIIDLIMPVGNTLDIQKTRRNIDTGLELIKRMKRKFKNAKIVVYSQLKDSEKAKKYCATKGIPFWEKGDVLPSEFVSKIIEYVG